MLLSLTLAQIGEDSKLLEVDSEKSVCRCNSMIGELTMHGSEEKALERFWEMQISVIEPDDITLTAVWFVCSHSGLVEKGKEIFIR